MPSMCPPTPAQLGPPFQGIPDWGCVGTEVGCGSSRPGGAVPAACGHQLPTVHSCQGKFSFPVLQEWSCLYGAVQSFPIPPYPNWFIWWWQKKESALNCASMEPEAAAWACSRTSTSGEWMETSPPTNLHTRKIQLLQIWKWILDSLEMPAHCLVSLENHWPLAAPSMS